MVVAYSNGSTGQRQQRQHSMRNAVDNVQLVSYASFKFYCWWSCSAAVAGRTAATLLLPLLFVTAKLAAYCCVAKACSADIVVLLWWN
jgi:hypothetical protein